MAGGERMNIAAEAYVDGMTEALSLAGMTVMCEGKDQPEFGVDVSPCSPRGEEIMRMRQELEAARRSIAEKDEKMCRMSRIQDSVDAEVQELTEKLFQEAYRMVNYAEERRERAEKLLNESRLQSIAHSKADMAMFQVDPILMAEFTSWREAGHPFVHHPFMDRINTEEISPCMLFHAKELSDAILDSIAANKLELEPVHEDKPTIIPCALTNVSRFCPYRVRVSEDAEWHRISLLARNRIAAVCDYYTFIRYLRQGLIKAGVRDTYFDVMALRKNMCLAKLGLGFVPKTNLRPGF
ncbi:hypothetical protein ANCCEY_13771 [Ancylostoma ceylanicum]|uniref:GDP/GTP exchange factor Sec2 N-terminal domain-containing protein n=1 Tax=Ancylostoma ceylanicum TaxID=53326 RepID=A0A0D6L679_9BILA|nr:hypothetical protein ANCCEY_13771 [Ancylostoma ceylanicum]